MSISYQDLHAKALPYVPEGTVKETTTWIAILLHSITSFKEINGRNDFLWLKCHSRITLRTIKHEYFTRHPLEEFHLKFHDVFPDARSQVKFFSRHNPVKNSNVVVFRAIEDINMPKELERTEAAKQKRALEGRGHTSDDAIAIDDDSDAEPTSSDGGPAKKRKLADADTQDGLGSGQITDDAEATDGTEGVDVASAMADYQPPYPQHWDWTAFLNRLNALPAAAFDRINASPWAHCEQCGKQMLLKPWTYFGLSHEPLCTNDSAQKMQAMGHDVHLQKMHVMRQDEFAEKHLQNSIGNEQNMDFDAGLNWPFQLGNVHMDLPAMRAPGFLEEAKDEDTGLVDGEDEEVMNNDVEEGQSMDEEEDDNQIDEEATGQERLNHFERELDDAAGQDLTDHNLQVYTVATTVNKPPTPPISDSGEDRAMADFRQEMAGQCDDDAASEDSFATAGEDGEDGDMAFAL